MSTKDRDSSKTEPLGSPDETRGGPNIEAAIANAEEGSVVEGVHTLPGEDENHDSRIEQMPAVDGVTEGRVEGTPGEGSPPKPGPSPLDIGSGGAQRLAGARISDRISAGQPVPDGPPFDTASRRAQSEQGQGRSRKPNKLVLAAIGVAHLAVAALTWRDLRARSGAQVRGSKRMWRVASGLNTVGSAAYWLAGRRRSARSACRLRAGAR
jgi:hypothetical protein